MKLTVLVENTACKGKSMGCAHGLSLYIETANHKILFDAGPDGDLLLANAKDLGIDLAAVDMAVLSHGHYDHSGGLEAFLKTNSQAKLYMQRHAAEGHYAFEDVGFRYIGIAPSIMKEYGERVVFADDILQVDDEILLFSDIKTADFLSGANSSLLEGTTEDYHVDPFRHEQNMIITEGQKHILVGGCAHRGSINILRRAEEIAGAEMDAMFSGFHLTNPGKKIDEPTDFVMAVGQELKNHKTVYFTGHCTGMGPFGILSEVLGDQVGYMSGGSVFDIE